MERMLGRQGQTGGRVKRARKRTGLLSAFASREHIISTLLPAFSAVCFHVRRCARFGGRLFPMGSSPASPSPDTIAKDGRDSETGTHTSALPVAHTNTCYLLHICPRTPSQPHPPPPHLHQRVRTFTECKTHGPKNRAQPTTCATTASQLESTHLTQGPSTGTRAAEAQPEPWAAWLLLGVAWPWQL